MYVCVVWCGVCGVVWCGVVCMCAVRAVRACVCVCACVRACACFVVVVVLTWRKSTRRDIQHEPIR